MIVIVVRDVEEAIVPRHKHAVGAFHLAADDARHRAVRVEAVDALHRLAVLIGDLHAFAVAVLRVGEVDAPLRVDGNVVGLVVAFALIALGEDGDRAVGLGARDAALGRLTGKKSALGVEE